jgi:hypothetical protein
MGLGTVLLFSAVPPLSQDKIYYVASPVEFLSPSKLCQLWALWRIDDKRSRKTLQVERGAEPTQFRLERLFPFSGSRNISSKILAMQQQSPLFFDGHGPIYRAKRKKKPEGGGRVTQLFRPKGSRFETSTRHAMQCIYLAASYRLPRMRPLCCSSAVPARQAAAPILLIPLSSFPPNVCLSRTQYF